MNRILIVEDDYAIAKIEHDFLMISGFESKSSKMVRKDLKKHLPENTT